MTDNDIVKSIREYLSQGKTKEEIYLVLLNEGFKVDAIQDSYQQAESKSKQEEPQKRTIYIILVIGALLIGAGIFSFIASNWQHMARPLKLFIIFISMIGSYGVGWNLRESKGLINIGSSFLLLGIIIYGAGIFLVAQMFHVRANWPDGFILWMIGALLLAGALESFLIYSFAVFLGVVSLFGHPYGIFALTDHFGPFMGTSSVLLLAATVISLYYGLKVRKISPPDQRDIY